MEQPQNILITSAGRRVALLRNFQREAKLLLPTGSKVFACDLRPLQSAACRLADGHFTVGRFTDADYIDVLLGICLENNIKLVVPTIDSELRLLAEHRDVFEKSDIHLIVSDLEFVKICRDKNRTNRFFEENGLKVPKALDKNELTFPAFVKSVNGSNSKDIYFLENEKMVFPHLLERDDLMFMEYLPKEAHTEFTVDMYFDRQNRLRCAVPRVRLEVRGGEVSKSVTKKNTLVGLLRERFSVMPGARGCITLQCFVKKSDPTVVHGIEINPRFGGGFPLSYAAGGNYANWLIREYIFGEEVAEFDGWADGLMMVRYDEDIFFADEN